MSAKVRVLILGGGFGGIHAAMEFERRKDPEFEVTVVMLRVLLVHPGEFILPELGEALGRYADKALRSQHQFNAWRLGL